MTRYVCASTHGLAVEGLEEKTLAILEEVGAPVPKTLGDAKLLFPPTPVMRSHGNWPLLTVSKGMLNLEEAGKFGVKETDVSGGANWGADEIEGEEPVDTGDGSGWGEDVETGEPGEEAGEVVPSEGDGWGFEDELEGLDKIDTGPSKHTDSFWTPPLPGPNFKQAWCNNSTLAADHVAAGSFESAMQLLSQQVGAVNFAPLKPYFMQLLIGSRASLPCTPSVPSLVEGLQRTGGVVKGRNTGLPVLFTGLPVLVERLKIGYRATTEGKFSEALNHFLFIIHNLLLIVVDSKSESNEAKELLGLCREYVTGIRLELARKELSTSKTDTSIRQAELAAYFTHCRLQPPHLILSLRSAMNCAYKIKNNEHAGSFAKRLLELNPSSAEIVSKARALLKVTEQNPKNESKIDYDERNPFKICAQSFTPIYQGSASTKCPYCLSSFQPAHAGKLCPTCQIAKIGAEAPGLTVCSSSLCLVLYFIVFFVCI